MKIFTIFMVLFSTCLTAQKSITENHINLLGTDIYIKSDNPFLRKNPPSSIHFPKNNVDLVYMQGNDLDLAQKELEAIVDSNVVETKVLIDDKEMRLFTFNDSIFNAKIKTLYYQKDSTFAMLTLTRGATEESKMEMDEIIKSVVVDFEGTLDKDSYYTFSFNSPQLFERINFASPGIEIYQLNGADPNEPTQAGIMFNEHPTMLEVDMEHINKQFASPNEESDKLIETATGKLLLKESIGQIGPDISSIQFFYLEGEFLATGMAVYQNEDQKKDIVTFLSSITKK